MSTRQAYQTDLSDGEWQHVELVVPAPKSGGRPAKYPRREIVNAILYVLRTKCAWRMLPHDFPPWRIVFYYYWRWRQSGLWDVIQGQLRGELQHPKRAPYVTPLAVSRPMKKIETGERGAMVRTRRVGDEKAA